MNPPGVWRLPDSRTARRGWIALRGLVLLYLFVMVPVIGVAQEPAGLKLEVVGIEGLAAENVINRIGSSWTSFSGLGSAGSQRRFLRRVEAETALALRPFGYYQAQVNGALTPLDGDSWQLRLQVEPGPPVLIGSIDVQATGAGASDDLFGEWIANWPLQPGAVLNQGIWDALKLDVLDMAVAHGFIDAAFTTQRIALNLDTNSADLALILETGQRAQFGTITFLQDFVDDAVLQTVPRFRTGDGYDHWQIDQFRTDLWKLGYFDTIDVREDRVEGSDPPVINVNVEVTPLHHYTHQGTIGFGTDTEFRTQYRVQRHQLSERGDSFTAGLALQQRNSEALIYGEYRLPRVAATRQYWLLNPIFTDRDQTFEVDIQGRTETLPLATGRVRDFYLRSGLVKLRHRERVAEPIIETLFVDYLYERNTISEVFLQPSVGEEGTDAIANLAANQYLSLGIDYDLPQFDGQGFNITGHRDRAWLFTSNEAWGSAVNFTQAYVSSRWVIPIGEEWRLQMRGELGYTNAPVQSLEIDDQGETLLVSLTNLPFRYRFFAGGSFSVRGYEYESLSNNGVGSNNLITGSVEIERRIWNNWSAAAFVDTGNAFNDWGDVRLFTGVGVGVRWYTQGFPIRVDVAQAQDLEGKPWRINLTIGSPLF